MTSSLRDSGPSKDTTTPRKGTSVDHILSCTPHMLVEPDIPDGGIGAWCTVLGGFLVQFCGYGSTNSFGVYQAFYAQHYLQNESSSAISWIGSLVMFLVTAMGPMCGRLFDRGYFYHVYIAGAILQSLSIFMLSLVQPGQYYQVLLAQGLAFGIGQGLMYVLSFAILSHHFKRRRATMMSIISSGASLGGIVNTIVLNKLLNGAIGFKTGVRISATFITVLLLLACILSRARYSAVHQEETPVNFWRVAKKCFMEVSSVLTIIGFTISQAACMYPYFYFQVDSLRHGLSPSFAFYSLVIMNASSFVARFAAGLVLPFVGVVNLTIISTMACTILIVGMIWLTSVASVVVLGLLFGFFSGLNIAMMAPMLGLTSEPAELGARLGVGFAITGIGNLVGPPICGALLTNRYLWWAPALFASALMFVAGILFIGVRFLLAHPRASEREKGGRSADGAEVAGAEGDSEKKEDEVVKA